MLQTSVPRILIAGTDSGVGKSLVVLGLLVALRKRGISVSCCVTGEALQHGLIYSRITRRYTRVLDRKLLGHADLLATMYQCSLGSDVVIIDGQAGLFDGVARGVPRGSDAEIASISGTPVVVVHALTSASERIARFLRKSSEFNPAPPVAGIIANRSKGDGSGAADVDGGELASVRSALGDPKLLGVLPETTFSGTLPSSQLSQDENTTALPMQMFLELGNLISSKVDIDALLAIAKSAAPIEVTTALPNPSNRLCRFAITDDSCFNLCYQDNLDLLKYCGAEMVPFSPVADHALPRRIGGLYVTGAYLKTYALELSQNSGIRRAIKDFADAGGVIYSEGAGTAFLCRSYQLEPGGQAFPGVGIIPGDAVAVKELRAPIKVDTFDDSVLGLSGISMRGIYTGEWALGGLHAGSGHHIVYTMRMQFTDREPVNEGYSASAQSCSTFNFLHFGSNPQIAKSLVEAAQVAERAMPQGS